MRVVNACRLRPVRKEDRPRLYHGWYPSSLTPEAFERRLARAGPRHGDSEKVFGSFPNGDRDYLDSQMRGEDSEAGEDLPDPNVADNVSEWIGQAAQAAEWTRRQLQEEEQI